MSAPDGFLEASDEWGQGVLIRASEIATIREAAGPSGDGRATVLLRSGTMVTVKVGFTVLAARLEEIKT